MERAAIGILALLGIVAVAAMLALAFGGHVVAALDSAFSKWRRLVFDDLKIWRSCVSYN